MNPLQIYRKHPSAPDTYYIGGGWSPACITAVDKRFTDAELAAEWWAAAWDSDMYIPHLNDPNGPRLRHFAAILEHFATLPHYDENPA